MKKAAATASFLIAGVLILFVVISFGVALNRDMERNSSEARDKLIKDSENGIVTVGGDDGPDTSTLLVCGLAGAAFLVAGFALWPKTTPPEPVQESE